MTKSIFDIFESKALAQYWEDVNTAMDDPFIGEQFFPVAKRIGLELAWIKGYNNLPIALQPSAFDTKATLRDRIGISKVETEMPFFREAMRIGEKDRQDLDTFLAKGDQYAQPTILKIFNDTKQLIDGANVQAERMRMSLLSSGTINILATLETGRDTAYNYNFDLDGSWATNNKITLANKWSVENKASSDPINDLLTAQDLMSEKRGVKVTKALLTTKTLNNLLASESIAKAINPNGATSMILTKKQKREFVEDQTGLQFIVYDKMFKNEQGVDMKYFPDDVVTLLPDYSLGNTWYGTTPEERDLMSGVQTNASTSIVNTGVAVTTVKEPHPVNVQTIVSEIVLPSFERMADIYVMNVNEA